MDMSKALDSTPHDLLIAKLHVYGFHWMRLRFFIFYLFNPLSGWPFWGPILRWGGGRAKLPTSKTR